MSSVCNSWTAGTCKAAALMIRFKVNSADKLNPLYKEFILIFLQVYHQGYNPNMVRIVDVASC